MIDYSSYLNYPTGQQHQDRDREQERCDDEHELGLECPPPTRWRLRPFARTSLAPPMGHLDRCQVGRRQRPASISSGPRAPGAVRCCCCLSCDGSEWPSTSKCDFQTTATTTTTTTEIEVKSSLGGHKSDHQEHERSAGVIPQAQRFSCSASYFKPRPAGKGEAGRRRAGQGNQADDGARPLSHPRHGRPTTMQSRPPRLRRQQQQRRGRRDLRCAAPKMAAAKSLEARTKLFAVAVAVALMLAAAAFGPHQLLATFGPNQRQRGPVLLAAAAAAPTTATSDGQVQPKLQPPGLISKRAEDGLSHQAAEQPSYSRPPNRRHHHPKQQHQHQAADTRDPMGPRASQASELGGGDGDKPTAANKGPRSSRAAAAEAAGVATDQAAGRLANRAPKFAFWRALVGRLAEIAGSSAASLDRLAGRLTEWPDQRRAALFYLELAARNWAQAPVSSAGCRRVSLAELMEPSNSSWLFPADGGAQEPRSSLKQRVDLADRLAGDGDGDGDDAADSSERPNTGAKLGQWLSRPGSSTGQLANRLAVELANLISRLLLVGSEQKHQQQQRPQSSTFELLGELGVGPKFFRYLLESRLRQATQPALHQIGPLHSAGLVFVDHHQQQQQRPMKVLFAPLALAGGPRQLAGSVELTAHPVASNKSDPNGYFNLDLLEPKGATPTADKSSMESIDNRGPPSFLAHWLLRAQLNELNQLEERLTNWLINDHDDADQQQQQRQQDLKSSSLEGSPLGLQDGSWFWPHFDCGVTNRWLLAYSIPFFARAPDNSVRFRGVSFVQLDLIKADKLIDQCQPDAARSFLANTHQCARLASSQCVPLTAGELRPRAAGSAGGGGQQDWALAGSPLRPGGYACQCPVGAQVAQSERQASEARRKSLRESILSRASADTGGGGGGGTNGTNYAPLDQLALEPGGGDDDEDGAGGSPFASRQLIGRRLLQLNQLKPQSTSTLQANNSQRQPYFTLGAQLEADTYLDWFAGDDDGDDDDDESTSGAGQAARGPNWPREVCRRCVSRAASTDNTTLTSTPAPMLDGDEAVDCPMFQEAEQAWQDGQPKPWWSWTTSGGPTRSSVLVLQASCMLVTLALIGILFQIRKSRLIIMSGWLMLETMLVGALLLYASVLVGCFQPTSLACLVGPWLRELGFSVFYGSILIKLYKILTEHQTRKAHRVCLRDKDQIVYLLAIVFIVIGYMSAWTALTIDGFFIGRSRQAHSPPLNQGPQPGEQQTTLGSPNLAAESPAVGANLVGGAEGPAASASADDEYKMSINDGRPSSKWGQFVGEDDSDDATATATTTSDWLSGALSSFSDLFSGLLERQLDPPSVGGGVGGGGDELAAFSSTRCRKLAWDYVTESSEMALLLFGLHLVYKLRNASSEMHKEKLILCCAVFVELLISTLLYLVRHLMWQRLGREHLLLLYAIRCQLTVSLTIGLVFGPKLWTIGKGKPMASLFGAFTSGGLGGFGAGGQPRTGSGSVRHRCNISCEHHDHHLDDATRLHQAMLSNAGLEIGSINLADMDPDEIQAELKRVYTQLEIYKTKAMRRDNPHISKRRGGRKQGHRKFSLQAFHARHSSSSEQHHNQASVQQQQPSLAAASSSSAAATAAVGQLYQKQQQQQQAQSATTIINEIEQHQQQQPLVGAQTGATTSAADGQFVHRLAHSDQFNQASRLPVVAEVEGEPSNVSGQPADHSGPTEQPVAKGANANTTNTGGRANKKHVRVDEMPHQLDQGQTFAGSGVGGGGGGGQPTLGANSSEQPSYNYHKHQAAKNSCHKHLVTATATNNNNNNSTNMVINNSSPKCAPEPPSGVPIGGGDGDAPVDGQLTALIRTESLSSSVADDRLAPQQHQPKQKSILYGPKPLLQQHQQQPHHCHEDANY